MAQPVTVGSPTDWAAPLDLIDECRSAGLPVAVNRSILLHRALAEFEGCDALSLDAIYWCGRATLVGSPEQIPRFDKAFRAFSVRDRGDTSQEIFRVEERSREGPSEGSGPEASGGTWSATEVLREKRFDAYTEAERHEAHALMDQMEQRQALQPSRRRIATHRDRGRPDVRETVRQAIAVGGEPIRRTFTTSGNRKRRLVLLLDVSGSMEEHARFLLRFAHGAVAGASSVEAFALGTRLTRLTRDLADREPDRAIRRATLAAKDWSGGTRLGDTLASFNDKWGIGGLARGATVVFLSDGWDRGDPEMLGLQMKRLSLVTHRLIWVNPLKSTPGFEPLTRGMRAAVPYVDEMVDGASLRSLEDLVKVISR